MSFEVVEYDGRRYAEIIWAGTSADKSVFFSPADSSFQFGLLAHDAGFVEPAHYHPQIERQIDDLQQMFVVQKGLIAVDFFSDSGDRFREVILRQGDAILLIHGAHSVRVLETMQCISVKQGPFLGAGRDKVDITVKR
ncbi:MAG: hypothetical protein JWP51_5180 [Bradyrhizobium sp.]|jgi:hypothetical protein|nr:hypothetical protein [Bradyrhizobium sp.]